MRYQNQSSSSTRRPSAAGSCDGTETTDPFVLEVPEPAENLRAIKAAPTATAANAATTNKIVWCVSGPLVPPLFSAWLALDKPGVGKPRSTPVGAEVGEGANVTELVGATVPVGATWGGRLGEGLGATVPEGVTCGAVVPGESITVGVGVETGVDVTVPADGPLRLSEYGIDMAIGMDMPIGIDKVIGMDMAMSSRRAL
jgi:hypothetical protein